MVSNGKVTATPGAGEDARPDTTSNALGTQGAAVQDNSGDASCIWLANSLDLTGTTELKVEFSFVAVSMDQGTEDFWVQFSDNGSSWATVRAYVVDTDFSNDVRENPALILDNSSYNFSPI